MSMKKIRLTLARDHDFPQGSDRHGYEFVAPLTDDGHIDAEAWRQHRDACRVRRFWAGEDEEIGHLVHTRGRSWAFHYDISGDVDDDEAGFKFDSHQFLPGEYVSITEHDGRLRTFRIAHIEDLSDAKSG
ncbi:MAG: hypothetical protein QNJ67_15115 [Kiloniellales bacterium]|nr:hypothetical protein [Kiloniellales bacterium]